MTAQWTIFPEQIHFIRLYFSCNARLEWIWLDYSAIFSMEKFFFFSARGGVQYPRIFPIHSRIIPFYSRNFTFITQEITNTLLKKFECPYWYLRPKFWYLFYFEQCSYEPRIHITLWLSQPLIEILLTLFIYLFIPQYEPQKTQGHIVEHTSHISYHQSVLLKGRSFTANARNQGWSSLLRQVFHWKLRSWIKIRMRN